MAIFGRLTLAAAVAVSLVASLLLSPPSPALATGGGSPSVSLEDPSVPPADPSETEPPLEPEVPGTPTDPPPTETPPPTVDPDVPEVTPSPGEPTPVPPSEEDEPRGPNGDLASDSPGPDTARPVEERPASAYSSTGLIGDNYPSRYRNLPWPYPPYQNIWDEWNFAYRQCTSFVSWRLNSANGVAFSNQYLGLTRWGNAGDWAASARSVGIRVDTSPEVGSVAWSGPWYGDASEFGHVAWVAKVLDNGNIIIEEYNNSWGGSYGYRTVHKSAFQGYIHIKDITKKFTMQRPTVTGTPMVGGTLKATVSGWTPQPTRVQYAWQRDGVPIAGATKETYQPTLEDLGAKLRVVVRGERTGYTQGSMTSVTTSAVMMTDSDGNGVSDVQELLPWNSDVDGDGRPDAVGFGSTGVMVSLNTKSGMGAAKMWVPGFGAADGWSTRYHPRTLVDVNGDGRSDVVGFASDGVYVSTSTGSGFTPAKRWAAGFGTVHGWSIEHHPRALADVNGDGLPDIVGFASDGVYVALGTGTSFKTAKRWTAGFGTVSGWRTDRHPRWVADMNGDGRADIVGIGGNGIQVALSSGTGFAASRVVGNGFSYSSGWRTSHHPRMLADVDGDGRLDVVGFASDGVYVSKNTGAAFGTMTRWVGGFGTVHGWLVGEHPRALADVNGDGKADIVGFANDGTYVSLSTGSRMGAPTRWTTAFNSKSWKASHHGRLVTDITGDGKADIVGFASDGVRVAASTGSRFGDASLALRSMGSSTAAGTWSVASHPRSIAVQRLTAVPAPAITGKAYVGQKLTASSVQPQPAPVNVAYQWRRDGTAIAGATARTYQPTSADAGAKITVTAVGSRFGYAKASATSAGTPAVKIGTISGTSPKITGTPRVGLRLVATPGNWSAAPDAVAYQWLRDGKAIAGATDARYTLAAADAASRISVRLTAAKRHYDSAQLTSTSTAKVALGTLVSAKPRITGVPTEGRTVSLDRGKWSSGVTFTYRWYRDGKAISGATAGSYKLVKADVGRKITAQITGKKSGYATVSVRSAATSKIGRRSG